MIVFFTPFSSTVNSRSEGASFISTLVALIRSPVAIKLNPISGLSTSQTSVFPIFLGLEKVKPFSLTSAMLKLWRRFVYAPLDAFTLAKASFMIVIVGMFKFEQCDGRWEMGPLQHAYLSLFLKNFTKKFYKKFSLIFILRYCKKHFYIASLLHENDKRIRRDDR